MRETALDLDVLAQTESVFALANGHIGLRGNLDEGEPFGLPGTYLNSFYELRPLPYAEARLRLPGVRPDDRQRHEREAHPAARRRRAVRRPLRAAARARARARPPRRRAAPPRRVALAGRARAVRVRSTRLVSFVQRAVAAILYEVEPLEAPLRVVVQSELVANEPAPRATDDPRAAAALESPLVAEEFFHHDLRVVLVHSTRASKLGLAAGMDHLIEGPHGTDALGESGPDVGRVTVAADLAPGRAPAGREVPRVRLVEPALASGAPRRGRRRARGGAPHRLGRARRRAARATSTSSGSAPTSSSTATPSCSRRCASRCSTRSRPAPAPSSARSRRRA